MLWREHKNRQKFFMSTFIATTFRWLARVPRPNAAWSEIAIARKQPRMFLIQVNIHLLPQNNSVTSNFIVPEAGKITNTNITNSLKNYKLNISKFFVGWRRLAERESVPGGLPLPRLVFSRGPTGSLTGMNLS